MATSDTNTPDAAVAPADLAEMVQAGTAALNDGDLRLALDRFEAVVMAFPDQPEGHNNLGALYSSIGDFEKAEQCFDRVLDLLPGNPNVHYNRGLVRSRLAKFDAARVDFTAVLQATPNDPDTLNNLGVAAYMEGRLDEARGHFGRAIAIRPGYVNAMLNLVDVECLDGDFAGAIRKCEEFLADHNSLEVRRKHLELLCTHGRETLAQAAVAAESILAVAQDPEVGRELGRISQARAAWQSAAAATM